VAHDADELPAGACGERQFRQVRRQRNDTLRRRSKRYLGPAVIGDRDRLRGREGARDKTTADKRR
jgi:hypothetical protein